MLHLWNTSDIYILNELLHYFDDLISLNELVDLMMALVNHLFTVRFKDGF